MVDLSSYPPIADYAFLSDCNSAALVSRSGSIDWACLRRFDANSVFGRLLDWQRGGFFAVGPVDDAEVSRRYVGDSLVVETRFRTASGLVRLRDAFSMHDGGERYPHHHLLRTVEALEGEVEMAVRIQPRFDFGELRPLLRQHEDTGAWSAVGGNTALVISGDQPLQAGPDPFSLSANVLLRAGERARFSVESQLPRELVGKPPPPEEIDRRMDATIQWWHRWSEGSRVAGPHAKPVRRAAAVLKGLTCGPTGAVVAAPTTSLPEAIGGERNWDYRHSWIRDASLVVAALSVVEQHGAAREFRNFLLRSAGGSPEDLVIMYGLDGSRHLPEHIPDLLEGYKGSRPVRVGNDAFRQQQHDMYGQLLDVAHLWHVTHEPLAEHEWSFLRGVVDRAAEVWTTPDRGIWERRDAPWHHVHSKAMLWAALDRGIRFVEEEGFDGDADRWRDVRDEIRGAIDTRGVRDGSFVQHFDTDKVDASLLELPMIGFVAAGDPRMRRTVERIRDELATEKTGFIRRYRTERIDDGLLGSEGVFLLCSFWLVDVLSMQGETGEAQALFDRLLDVANDAGLFAEQYDADRDILLGNFPQAFTHMALINSAHHLACAEGFDAGCREQPWSTADRVGDRRETS